MPEQPEITKSELIEKIDRTWSALQSALDQLTPEQLDGVKDAEGWTVKDHVLHMAAWERSVVFLLNGKPRYEGLGVSEALYLGDSVDPINAAIFATTSSLSAPEAMAQHRGVHAQMMALLHSLSNEDLEKSYRHFRPDEDGEGDGPPVINIVYGNTSEHYKEHLAWIETLAGKNQ